MSSMPRHLLRLLYARSAEEYLDQLPPEHFMEATAQATQRTITLASLQLVEAQRPDFHLFNELLVQYPRPRKKKPGQVVPDNMVVLYEGPIEADGSYDVVFQPCAPFWVLEYVSKKSERKDYDGSFDKYERELKVPYALFFYPDNQCLTLFRHTGKKYTTVVLNESGQLALPEVEMAVALVDGWVRFWYRGELLPLPADLLRQVAKERKQREDAERQVKEERRQREEMLRLLEQERQSRLELEQELARLRAQVESPKRKKNGGPG